MCACTCTCTCKYDLIMECHKLSDSVRCFSIIIIIFKIRFSLLVLASTIVVQVYLSDDTLQNEHIYEK